MTGGRIALVALAMLAGLASAAAQDEQTPPPAPPAVPSLEQIAQEKQQLPDYVPLDVNFRIGIVGDFKKELKLETGTTTQIKSPLILIDPRTGKPGVYAKNFPARIVGSSRNGVWVVGITPSGAVEGSSGSRSKECAVSLNLNDSSIKMIAEFPTHSNFQALFAPTDNKVIYYCINEPGAENAITRYDLQTQKAEPLPAEGNRFYLFGLTQRQPGGVWASDPLSTKELPILDLYDLQTGAVLQSVSFPGVSEVVAQPSGDNLLALVSSGAEASLGYYSTADSTFHQVPKLVLTRPSVKWLRTGMTVIAKESTVTQDRFLSVDLATGEARELFSGMFKVAYWDISPNDDALVFIIDSPDAPILFVVPLDPKQTTVNRIRLVDVTNISWIGCLNPPSGGSWLDRIMPF